MSVSSASASLPPSESQSAHTNKHDNPNTHANPNVQEECLDRLKALMNEYDQLERSEDNLLELLYQLRHDDGCLVQALNDEIFARIGGRRPLDANNTNTNNNNNNTNNNNNDNSSASTAVATTTPSTKTNLGLLPEVPLLMSQLENETKEPPRMQSGANQPQRLIARHQLQQQQQQKPVEPSIDVVAAAAAAPITMGPSKRRKRGHTGATTQQPSPPPFKLHNARHLEANRHVQRREERVLARRKLEDALFADEDGDDDDDDDDDNSSSPS